jgi:hypothetical protein
VATHASGKVFAASSEQLKSSSSLRSNPAPRFSAWWPFDASSAMCVRQHLPELRSGTREREISSRRPSFHRLLHGGAFRTIWQSRGSALAQSSESPLNSVEIQPYTACEDAGIDLAAAGIMAAKLRNTGQTCISASRSAPNFIWLSEQALIINCHHPC